MAFLPSEHDRPQLAVHPKLTDAVRVQKIIVFALLSGVLMFGAFVGMQLQQQPLVWQPGTIGLVGLELTASATPLSFILPGIIRSSQAKAVQRRIEELQAQGAQEPADSLDGPFGDMIPSLMSSTIVSGALLEGAAFMNLVAAMVESSVTSLAAAVVLWLLLLTKIPTVNGWTDALLQLAEKQRQAARDSF